MISHSQASHFPLARVRKITKLNPSVHTVSKEAVLALEKAAQLFVQDYTRTALSITEKHKRKTMQMSDMEMVAEIPEF